MGLTRRRLLATTVTTPSVAVPGVLRARTQQKLSIASHRIHQIVSTGAKGGDITRRLDRAHAHRRRVDHVRSRAAAGSALP